MNQELLNIFRAKVNDNGIMLKIFRDYSGKNKWSIICSAMDWIEVALDGIDPSILSRENDNKASIKMITFVSCVDILWEAIQQLHRGLFKTKKIPFRKDFSVFKQSVSDNEYFKTIRACFSAHPVNLKRVYPDDMENERWYASWSGGTFSKKDFSVILYSNNPNKESRFFDVSFSEIYEFAEKRYQYLKVLMNQIDTITNDYLNSFRNKPIVTGDNTTEIIDVLIDENKKRFGNDYFDYELQKIKKVFNTSYKETEKNIFTMEKYRRALRNELDEIKLKLQNMNQENLENQVDDAVPMDINYPFSKLSDAVWQHEYCFAFEFVVDKIKSRFSDIIDIDSSMSQEEVYVLACAAAYSVNCCR